MLQGSPAKKAKLSNGATSAAMAKVEASMAPSSFRDELRATAQALVAEGKGLLACDEPPKVLPGRMKMCYEGNADEVCDEAWRINYREMMFTTPGLSNYISGVILHEETVNQPMSITKGAAKVPCAKMLSAAGIVAGVKVDRGFKPMLGLGKETHTQGLDDLGERCKAFYAQGARFAKWRAPLYIGEGIPSETALRLEAHSLARYASICQENGLMPIVEPDVVMDGTHGIEVSAMVTKKVLTATFNALDEHNVDIEGAI